MFDWLHETKALIEDWNRQLRDRLPPRTIHDAAYRGDIKRIRKFLARTVSVSAPDEYGVHALGYAAAQGHLETVRLLLEEGAPVDGSAGSNVGQAVFTPLMGAITGGHKEVVRLLIDHRAKVKHFDKFGETALSLAAIWSDAEVVGWLLAAGAEINVADKKGMSTLMKAIFYRKAELVTLLLANGALVNAQDAAERTALMIAAKEANVPGVNLLLEYGADVLMTDKADRIALDYAQPHAPYLPAEFFAPIVALLEHAGTR